MIPSVEPAAPLAPSLPTLPARPNKVGADRARPPPAMRKPARATTAWSAVATRASGADPDGGEGQNERRNRACEARQPFDGPEEDQEDRDETDAEHVREASRHK